MVLNILTQYPLRPFSGQSVRVPKNSKAGYANQRKPLPDELFQVAAELFVTKEDKIKYATRVSNVNVPHSYPAIPPPKLVQCKASRARDLAAPHHSTGKQQPRGLRVGPAAPWMFVQGAVTGDEMKEAWRCLEVPQTWLPLFDAFVRERRTKDHQLLNTFIVAQQIKDTLIESELFDRVATARAKLRANGAKDFERGKGEIVWQQSGRKSGEAASARFLGHTTTTRSQLEIVKPGRHLARPSVVGEDQAISERMRRHYKIGSTILESVKNNGSMKNNYYNAYNNYEMGGRYIFGRWIRHAIGNDAAVFDACDVDRDSVISCNDMVTFMKRLDVGVGVIEMSRLISDFSRGKQVLDRCQFEAFLIESIAADQLFHNRKSKKDMFLEAGIVVIRNIGLKESMQLIDDVALDVMSSRLHVVKSRLHEGGFTPLREHLDDYFSLDDPSATCVPKIVLRFGMRPVKLLCSSVLSAHTIPEDVVFAEDIIRGLAPAQRNGCFGRLLLEVRLTFGIRTRVPNPLSPDDFLMGLSKLGFAFRGGNDEQEELVSRFQSRKNPDCIDYNKVEKCLMEWRVAHRLPCKKGGTRNGWGLPIRAEMWTCIQAMRVECVAARKELRRFVLQVAKLALGKAAYESTERWTYEEAHTAALAPQKLKLGAFKQDVDLAERKLAALQETLAGADGNFPAYPDDATKCGTGVLLESGINQGAFYEVLMLLRQMAGAGEKIRAKVRLDGLRTMVDGVTKETPHAMTSEVVDALLERVDHSPEDDDWKGGFINYYDCQDIDYAAFERLLVHSKMHIDESLREIGNYIVTAAANKLADLEERKEVYDNRHKRPEIYR